MFGSRKNKKSAAARPVRVKKAPKLVSYYWGYKANEQVGIEIAPRLSTPPFPLEMIEGIKECADNQLKMVREDKIPKKYALNREDFLAQEQERLDEVASNWESVCDSNDKERILESLVVAACAITTLVAYKRIPQDEFNGDKFGYAA